MKIYLTVDISELDICFDSFLVEKLSIDFIYEKNPFLLKSESKIELFDCLVKEILNRNKDILIGNAIFTINDVLILINILTQNNLEVTNIFLPSDDRLKVRMNLAISEIYTIGRNEGVTKNEVERNYCLYQNRLAEFFKKLQKINIESKFI